jgi:hypothetical protein
MEQRPATVFERFGTLWRGRACWQHTDLRPSGEVGEMNGRIGLALVLLCGCGGGGGGDDAEADAAVAAQAVCDMTTHRAVLDGTFTCPAAPAFTTIEGAFTYRYDIFTYEASHPLATEDLAFPCAASTGIGFEAPKQATPACSRPGVRPWHSVRWEEADRACKQVGPDWRLCTGAELERACGGPEKMAYTYGPRYQGGACNVLQSWANGPSGTPSEAPTGSLPKCKSPEGVYDLNGNLWEWTRDVVNDDGDTRIFQGAGWRIIPERHRESDQVCNAQNVVPGVSARTYSNADVGFRCCRTAH